MSISEDDPERKLHQILPIAPRPWVRLWARSIDLSIAGSIFGLFWDYLGPPFNTKWVVACMLTAFLWVPFEAIFLSTYGTTPGKWFLRTTLRDSNGKIPTFKQCLRRGLYVWSWGFGIGFYYATLVGMLFSYLDLKDKGATRWDRDGGFEISHEKISVRRGVLVTFLYFCFPVMMVLLSEVISGSSQNVNANETIGFLGILFVINFGLFTALQLEDDK